MFKKIISYVFSSTKSENNRVDRFCLEAGGAGMRMSGWEGGKGRWPK
jgi:hypothetical protein